MKRGTRVAMWIAVALVLIVGILVSPWILPNPPNHQGRRNYCEALIGSLEQALSMYESDHGNYPASGPAGLLALEDRTNRGAYFEFKPSQKDGEGRVLDPWGHPFVYRVRRNDKGRERPYICSTGPNGIDEGGNGDDVTNND